MVKKKHQVGKIIIPAGMKPRPREHEVDAAQVLAEYLKLDVEFVLATDRRSPDFLIGGVLWELKSPQGKGRNNIERQLKYAGHQSPNVIIDAARSKIHATRLRREVEYQFKMVRSVSRLIYIAKDRKVVEIDK